MMQAVDRLRPGPRVKLRLHDVRARRAVEVWPSPPAAMEISMIGTVGMRGFAGGQNRGLP